MAAHPSRTGKEGVEREKAKLLLALHTRPFSLTLPPERVRRALFREREERARLDGGKPAPDATDGKLRTDFDCYITIPTI